MELLKKENWYVWVILYFLTGTAAAVFLSFLLNLYDKNEWYSKWQNWLLGILVFPIMLMVFIIQSVIKIAVKFKVPGSEYYASPYIWILMIIIPIFGWIMLLVTSLYLQIMIIVSLYEGKAEKYIK